jgi:hypothetical protein
VLLALFVVLAPLVTQRIYASDEIEYFAFTHSLFFDQDLDFSNEYLHFYQSDTVKFQQIYTNLYLKREPVTNLPINVAPIGTGLLWLPSYALAHLLTVATGGFGGKVAADGYSQPYIAAVCLTSYLFGCLGLLLCFSLARRLFGDGVSALAVATMWLATPLIFYTVVAPPWSHATSLLTVTLFLWYWDRTRAPTGRTWLQWTLLGAAAGLMMLVREQDALFVVVPVVEALAAVVQSPKSGVQSATSVVGRRSSFLRWALGLALMGGVALLTFVPQLATYKVITGHFAPSKVVSSKFTLTSPDFLNVLFSSEHGLLPWTPVVALALVGLIPLWRRDRLLSAAFALAFLLQVYIAGSFLTWQSAGSFGQRRFINCTVIFVLGLAALLAWLLAHGWPRWLVGALVALLVAWNAGLLMQYALWCSPQRQGLDWATVIKGQIEMPTRAASLLWDYITDRQRFYRRTPQC